MDMKRIDVRLNKRKLEQSKACGSIMELQASLLYYIPVPMS